MNFKQTREDVDTVCCMVKKHVKTHSVQTFSRPSKTTLQIWPTDIFLQSVNMLVVCRTPMQPSESMRDGNTLWKQTTLVRVPMSNI